MTTAVHAQTYIAQPMKFRRSRKRQSQEAEVVAKPSYAQLAANAADAQLASLAAAGDDAAFTTLVTRYQPAVFRWALIFSRDADEAEDIAQEVFVRMYRQLDQYRSDGLLSSWLYTITRRTANQTRRTLKRRSRLALSPAARPEREIYTTDPGGRVDRQRIAGYIRHFFTELPPRQREVFDLVDLQGHEPAEVAEMLGLKQATLRANLFKARAAIRANIIAAHPAAGEIDR